MDGLGSNIYTVFHHDADTKVVSCATLANAICSGWPAISTYVDPVAGTALGTGKAGQYVTAGENGSFIANGNLYWGVQGMAPVDPKASVKTYEFGVQCLNLTVLDELWRHAAGHHHDPPRDRWEGLDRWDRRR